MPMVQVTAVISPEERKKNIMKFAGIWKDLDTETILIDIEKVKQAGSKTKFWWEE